MRRLGALSALLWLACSIARGGVGVWTTSGPPGVGGPFSIAVDGYRSGTVYALMPTGLFRSDDDGGSWLGPMALPAAVPGFFLLGAADGSVYLGLYEPGFGPFPDIMIYKSEDAGATWATSQSLVASFVRFVFDPVDRSVIYEVASQSRPFGAISAIYRTVDGGVSWTPIGQGVAAGSFWGPYVDSTNPNALYIGSTTAGANPTTVLYRSADRGNTWTALPSSFRDVTAVAIDPPSRTIYVDTLDRFFGSTDGGVTFRGLNPSIKGFTNLIIDPKLATRLFVAASIVFPPVSGALKSEDGGLSWISIDAGLPPSVQALAIDQSGAYLHALTGEPGVYDYQISGTPGLLLLNAARPFTVSLSATDPHSGQTAPGVATPINDLSGYFSIPAITDNPNNPEVFVKLLDGTGINGSYWFFYGGLTNLEYVLTVTDVTTGQSRHYSNPGGSECGGSDTAAFTP